MVRWPHWHWDSKRGWFLCNFDHKPGKKYPGRSSLPWQA